MAGGRRQRDPARSPLARELAVVLALKLAALALLWFLFFRASAQLDGARLYPVSAPPAGEASR